jgi:hypothetical protein
MLTEQDKSAIIKDQKIDIHNLWNDSFPPLNLWNYPAKWISEVFYNKDNDVWY